MPQGPTVLAILDGWGVAPPHEGNAIYRANTPYMDRFVREYPAMNLFASGNEVGLLFGEMGNSEVGHLNIGAGRVYYQTFPRIEQSIASGEFAQKKALRDAITHVKEKKSTLHLMGLLSPGNVHASQAHCHALLDVAKAEGISEVFVHAFLDGRDTTYNSAQDFIANLEAYMQEIGLGKIASLAGRYYAMDRDNRWERIEQAYRAIVDGTAAQYADSAAEAIAASYATEVFDEEFIPTVIGSAGKPTATVSDSDAVIFFNFRPDRARQLTKAFVLPSFPKFEREYIQDLCFVTMTEYEKELPVDVVFPPVIVHNCLAEAISKAGLRQFHIAETEKYAHITFFLNGTVEAAFEGEERKIIPSPKVSSYDQAPEMSAPEIAKEVVRAIQEERYDVIFLNFANADMVAHTGDLDASIKACETVDKSIGIIAEHVLAKQGMLLITADHGNAEEVANLKTGGKDKEHSTNPVPFLIIRGDLRGEVGPSGDPIDGDMSLLPPVGMLADVAPTMLSLMGVDIPEEMTGQALM